MKKKLFTIALALCMVFTMIPGGVFQAETAWADTTDDVVGNVTSVQIAGQPLNASAGLYYYNGVDGAAGTVSSNSTLDGQTPNATFDPSTGTLTLNGLNVTAETGIVWNYSSNSNRTHNLVIKLEGSPNTINSGSTSAIHGQSGYPNDGPSLTIIGSGRLTLNGSYGIWVWHNITIGGNVVVKATGSKGGIYNSDSAGKIVIKDNANVTAEGGTEYGVGANLNYASTVEIKGGTLEAKSSNAAMKTAPDYDSHNFTVIASENKDGTNPADYYLASNISSYKYLKFTQQHTHCICGATHKAVGDHTNSNEVTFEAWTRTDSLPSQAGNYYLTDDVALGWTWNIDGVEGEVVLCLNGHKISTQDGKTYTYGSLIDVRSSNLTLTDCRGTGKVINNGNVLKTGGIYIGHSGTNINTSTVNMYEIAVEGFTEGGVNLGNSAGKFNMYSGKIQNNNSQGYSSGVTVGLGSPGYGFYMYGGTITNNTTTNADGGGGVLAYAPFTIGGEVKITGNYKNTDAGKILSNVHLAYSNSSNIAISRTASPSSRIGVTTRKTLTADDAAVTIAKGVEGENISLDSFTSCFTSDVNSSRIRPTVEDDAIKLKYFAKDPQEGFAYSTTTVEKTYGEDAFTNATLAESSLKESPQITYSSNNTKVATVEANTGKVTIVGAGTAVITATADETQNYAAATARYTINVAKLEINAPAADATNYTYDGTAKNYQFAETQDALYYTINGNTPQTAANEDGYTITVSLDDKRNTVWSDTNDTADKTYKFVIKRKTITVPAADPTEYVYDGKEKTYQIAPGTDGKYTVTGNKQTNAGTYTVTVTPGANYKWIDGTTGDETYPFIIQKQQIADPELIKSTFVYSGETITPEFTETPDKFELVGAISAKDAYANGYYMITATPKENYKLSDGRKFTNLLWEITKAPLTIQPKEISIQEGDELPTNFEVEYNKLKGSDKAETAVTGTMKFELLKADGTVLSDSKTAGEYRIHIANQNDIKSDNYDITMKDGKLTITKKPSSSGGGSSAPRTDVTTTGKTDSKVTSSPSEVKNETKTDANGNNVTTATVTVSSANQREILRQAKANKSGEIIIKVSQNEVKDGAKVEMNLDKSFIESIVNDTDAKLTIQTPSGEKTFTQEELKKLAAEATGSTVTIDPTSAGTIKPTTPTEPTAPTNPSTDKNAKLVKGVENTTIVLKSKLTKEGKVLLTWTKSKGYKVDKFEVYRSVKRHSGYGTKAFFTTKDGSRAKYLNTKSLKKGKTYYYKVRGVRTIEGQKYYTQWSNKVWRTVK